MEKDIKGPKLSKDYNLKSPESIGYNASLTVHTANFRLKNNHKALSIFTWPDYPIAGTRDKLVKQRAALVNKIYIVLNRHGLTWKKETLTTEKGLKSIMAFDWEPIVRVELEVLVEQIRSLTKSIKKLDDQMSQEGKKLGGHKNLTSIKGIGERSATVLLSIIGDVNDFADENKLAAYFGIVPRVSDSNEKVYHGRITKNGSKIGRTTLVQCTLVAKRYSPYLRKYYEHIRRHRGSGKVSIYQS